MAYIIVPAIIVVPWRLSDPWSRISCSVGLHGDHGAPWGYGAHGADGAHGTRGTQADGRQTDGGRAAADGGRAEHQLEHLFEFGGVQFADITLRFGLPTSCNYSMYGGGYV